MHVSGHRATEDADRSDQYVTSVIAEVAIARARAEVSSAHADLLTAGLVTAAEGSVSARVPATDLFVITPADALAGELTPDAMILCDVRGGVVVAGTPGAQSPVPADVAAHAHVYGTMGEVGGIVHVASPYATGWAARGEEIPCVVTAMADEFGGAVPVAPLAADDAQLGAVVVETLRGQRSPALLVQNRGAIAVGTRARAAARIAVKLENVARIAQLARQGGAPVTIPQAVIDARYDGSARRPERT